MGKAREYIELVERYPRTLATADAAGEQVESFAAATPAQRHWAKIEGPGGSESGAVIVSSGDGMRVRFRNKITLTAVDHVYVVERAQEYAVTGVWLERAEDGGLQTVCGIAGPA